jgi:uncharacterized glyoxalase superfamily protein PhnB
MGETTFNTQAWTMAETFFAFRFARLRDKFGTSWMILNSKPQNA